MTNARLHAIASQLWPGSCLLCRARIEAGEDFCRGCLLELPCNAAACPRCAAALPSTTTAPCGRCQRKPPKFDRTWASLQYTAPVDRLVLDLKYHRRLELARTLGRLLANDLQGLAKLPDMLIPVPLHPSRLRERGYNQSLELARVLAKQLKLPLAARAAKRVRATPAQAGLPLKERARNMRNAFSADPGLKGRHVAIVDDVMTSGHTVNALAQALRRAGAGEIDVWVVARA